MKIISKQIKNCENCEKVNWLKSEVIMKKGETQIWFLQFFFANQCKRPRTQVRPVEHIFDA